MLVEEKIYETVGQLYRVDVATLNEETRMKEDLHATSQTLFAFSAFLEKLAEKKISYADVNNCATLGDVIALVKK